LANAIKKGKRAQEGEMRLASTVEFFPEEGKYHYDGHRACKTSLRPEDTKRLKGVCPVCARKVTVGVLSRIEALADRPEGFRPPGAIPFKSMVTLDKIIGDAIGVGETSKAVRAEYKKLIEHFGNEFSILLEVPISDLSSATLPEITEGIRRMREGKVKVEPGYDGEYGKIQIFEEGEQKVLTKQVSLF
jgi:PHP family Zn ribbon phosphoesterase